MEFIIKGLFNYDPKTVTKFLLWPDSFIIEDQRLDDVRKTLALILIERFIQSLNILSLSPKNARLVSHFVKLMAVGMSDEDFQVMAVIGDQSKLDHFSSRLARICFNSDVIVKSFF